MTTPPKILIVSLALMIVSTLAGIVLAEETPQDITLVFEINNDLTVKQLLSYEFINPYTEKTAEFTFNEEIQDLKITGDNQNLPYRIIRNGTEHILIINTEKQINSLSIEFTRDDFIFKNDNEYFFFTEMSFPISTKNVSAELKIPQGYILNSRTPQPKDYLITSDGRKIIIKWESIEERQGIFFSASFEKTQNNSTLYTLIFILLGTTIFYYTYLKKKANNSILAGFSEKEREAILHLRNKKRLWQKDLQKHLDVSRVKATRIVKKLQEKNLIDVENFGRENKILWKREGGIVSGLFHKQTK